MTTASRYLQAQFMVALIALASVLELAGHSKRWKENAEKLRTRQPTDVSMMDIHVHDIF
jgi:hypothetical protein